MKITMPPSGLIPVGNGVDTLIGNEYLNQRMASFSFDKATLSSDISHGSVHVVESNTPPHT